ncbi:MAG: ABC transporter permease [Synergistaceae bacterium]|jgi:peptide/nickel transport system permease protein|nr:ABC transporter permease [Synergistaceae bacterium]
MEIFLEALKPRISSFRESVYLLSRNRLSMLAFIVLAVIILLALLSPIIAPYPEDIADAAHITEKFLPPSQAHGMGTDELGRDILSRVLYGGRVSVATAVIAVGISLLIGVPLGALAGAYGRKADNIIMRVTDIFLSFPPLLLAIALVAIMGSGLTNAILAISFSWWPWYTRLVRGQAVSIRERVFVQAAETIGTSKMKIIFRHILPNCISPVIVQASMDMGGVILTVASLSFLGLGAKAPLPEWGLMISTGRIYFPDKWWYCIFPGVAIFITVLCFNLLGDAIREILDPKTRKR